jgi:hypothetical protein
MTYAIAGAMFFLYLIWWRRLSPIKYWIINLFIQLPIVVMFVWGLYSAMAGGVAAYVAWFPPMVQDAIADAWPIVLMVSTALWVLYLFDWLGRQATEVKRGPIRRERNRVLLAAIPLSIGFAGASLMGDTPASEMAASCVFMILVVFTLPTILYSVSFAAQAASIPQTKSTEEFINHRQAEMNRRAV